MLRPCGAVTCISSAIVAPSRSMQWVWAAPNSVVESETHRLNPASTGPATAAPNWKDGSCPSGPASTSVARTAAEIPRSVPLAQDHARNGAGGSVTCRYSVGTSTWIASAPRPLAVATSATSLSPTCTTRPGFDADGRRSRARAAHGPCRVDGRRR